MLIYTFSPFKEAETEGDDDCSISRFPQKKKFFSRILIFYETVNKHYYIYMLQKETS